MRKNTFACYVLTDKKLKKYLNKKDMEAFKQLKAFNGNITIELADKIANAIKKWALSQNVTHFSHWFFPFASEPAEKQVSFLEYDIKGNIIEKFNGKSLVKTEVDSSSFPNGGEVSHFNARGYVKWDYNSNIFVRKDKGSSILYIPSYLITSGGLVLDEKLPLNRALKTLNRSISDVLNCIGYDIKNVTCNLGCEQEFFILDRNIYNKRNDLVYAGRTLFDNNIYNASRHYLGIISSRISNYFSDLNNELWKLGIATKIQHKECALSQYEIVTIFSNCIDEPQKNMLLIDVMNSIAEQHDLKVLFHEKPFKNISGSGKHNNWSISTDLGINLLDPNQCNSEMFLLIFTSVISSINKYYELLQVATYSYANCFRLGGSEAPPPIFSVHIGDDLFQALQSYCNNNTIDLKHCECNRNRTSAVAFTGNKFEFRLIGASQSVFFINTIIANIVAAEFIKILDMLENSDDKKTMVKSIIKSNIRDSFRIIFNGDNYNIQWQKETHKRGININKDTIKCYRNLLNNKSKELFKLCGVLNDKELEIRCKVLMQNYVNDCVHEAHIMCNMIHRQILPSMEKQIIDWDCYINNVKDCDSLESNKHKFIEAHNSLLNLSAELKCFLKEINNHERVEYKVKMCDKKLISMMDKIRAIYRDVESLFSECDKPFPTYEEILNYRDF